ncbi:hypothetical protein JR316_0004502 [Psilocybe cubensis]|uniref:Uncharacterized protein n=1 Tax=Psilocybe cubensis TaxID=181762 RepID=A0ACB8H435_PSICU|nr:hypothetical protein JR316_0004502 [Psilocybe cubensis]KAH9482402.1 hypothetical protein JR316_0004502 [Psilocybe cubensis]
MGKKGKGKQKQDEKLATGNDNATLLQPPLATEGANVPMMDIGNMHSPMHPPSIHQEHIQQVSQGTAWGSAPGDGNWDSPGGGFTESAIHTDNWASGTRENDGWHHADSLLDPPPVHSHNILPTIHEQIHEQSSSGHFETRTESIVGSEIYSDDDYGQETHRGFHSPYPQSRTGTATAAASAMGSPRPAPPVSLSQAAAEAAKLNNQHMSHASEAARKLEESKARQKDSSALASSAVPTPAVQHVPLAPPTPPAPDRTKMSTASAYAALHEKKNAPSAVKTPSAQPSTSGGKNTWQFRPVHPGDENARIIPTDPSWIMTGGNEWSNKHRTSKSAPAVPTAAYIDEDAWNRHLNHYRQAQQMQQAIHDKKVRQAFPAQHRPQHSKHHSHPGHPMHHQGPQHLHERQHQRHQHQQPHHPQQPQKNPKQNQKWQRWGKDGWNEEEEEETEEYSESGEETVDEWATAAQHSDAWAHSGGWEQPTRFAGERGRVPDKKAENHWGQAEPWGEVAGSGTGWRREASEGGGWGEAWGKQGGQQHHQHQQQQQKQHSVQRGHHPGHGNEWGSEGGWGQETSAWGKTDENAWGLLGVGGDRGKVSEWDTGGDRGIGGATNSRSEWPATAQHNQSKIPANVADMSGSRNTVSAQQRSQILNSFLNNAQGQKHAGGNAAQLHASALAAAQKGLPKNKVQHDAWVGGAWEAEDDGWGSLEDEDGYGGNRRVHFSPKTSDIWGGSPRSVPSKTLVHAQQGLATTPINDASNVRFVESRGAAFAYVSSAFFGNSRLARERIHWMFPVNKDKRVAAMHAWVQKMSFNIGTYGDPAFDWLTFNQLQGTMDKTLQESVAFYDPARLVIVFVYLPSQTGNSVAIWRIKVNVPDNARIKYQQEVSAITKTLRKDTEYIVMVDEIPPKPKAPQKSGLLRKTSLTKSKSNAKNLPYTPNVKSAPKEKRKWWKIFS